MCSDVYELTGVLEKWSCFQMNSIICAKLFLIRVTTTLGQNPLDNWILLTFSIRGSKTRDREFDAFEVQILRK